MPSFAAAPSRYGARKAVSAATKAAVEGLTGSLRKELEAWEQVSLATAFDAA